MFLFIGRTIWLILTLPLLLLTVPVLLTILMGAGVLMLAVLSIAAVGQPDEEELNDTPKDYK